MKIKDLIEAIQGDTEKTIKALRDTDYRDKDAFFRMTELIKGLAVASEKDEKAKKYLSAVSDALTGAAKKVLGEGLEEAKGSMPFYAEEAADSLYEAMHDAVGGTQKAKRAAKDRDLTTAVANIGNVVNSISFGLFDIAKAYGRHLSIEGNARNIIKELGGLNQDLSDSFREGSLKKERGKLVAQSELDAMKERGYRG